MSSTEVRVETTRTDINGENETLIVTFTSVNKAWAFYAKCYGAPGVVNATPPRNTIKTYGNVDKALEAVAQFAGVPARMVGFE